MKILENLIKVLIGGAAVWFFIHLFALLGPLVVLICLVVSIILPKLLPCLYCRIERDQEYCPLCREKVDKGRRIYAKDTVSKILNLAVLTALFIVSYAYIYVENRMLINMKLVAKGEPAVFVLPPEAEYRVDEIFAMDIKIDQITEPVNAVQADIKFDPELLEVVEVTTYTSFASVFLDKEINNNLGYLRISGGLPNPGYRQSPAVFGTVYFKGKREGLAKVEYLPSSLVLINDGHGTNILRSYAASTYNIVSRSQNENFKGKDEVVGRISRPDQILLYDETNILMLDNTEFDLSGADTRADRGGYWTGFELLHRFDEMVINLWQRF